MRIGKRNTESEDTVETSRTETRRRKRGEHGRGRLKLSVPEVPGYYCRWVNDVDNKLHDATHNDDFSHVTRTEINDTVGESGDGNSDLGSNVRVLVDKDEQGKPIYSYLLKKKQEFYEEDIAENEDQRQGREESLRRGSDSIERQYGEIK